MMFRSAVLAILLAADLHGTAAAQPSMRDRPAREQGDSPRNDWRSQQEEARAAVRAGKHVPLGRVLDSIRARTPGRQLDTALERGPDGRPVYRVRWAADNGRRMDYMVDAETGAILSGEGR